MNMERDYLEKILTIILTIDGKGRPAKAKLLLQLIEDTAMNDLKSVLLKISNRTGY